MLTIRLRTIRVLGDPRWHRSVLRPAEQVTFPVGVVVPIGVDVVVGRPLSSQLRRIVANAFFLERANGRPRAVFDGFRHDRGEPLTNSVPSPLLITPRQLRGVQRHWDQYPLLIPEPLRLDAFNDRGNRGSIFGYHNLTDLFTLLFFFPIAEFRTV